jgi:hypothetical protein
VAALDAGTAGNEDKGRPWMNLAGQRKIGWGTAKQAWIRKTKSMPV